MAVPTNATTASGSPNEKLRSSWVSNATSATATTTSATAIAITKFRRRLALSLSLSQTSPAKAPTISVAIATVALLINVSWGERSGSESKTAAIAAIEAAISAGPTGDSFYRPFQPVQLSYTHQS